MLFVLPSGTCGTTVLFVYIRSDRIRCYLFSHDIVFHRFVGLFSARVDSCVINAFALAHGNPWDPRHLEVLVFHILGCARIRIRARVGGFAQVEHC